MIDNHNRTINYLRLSVTDRCNLRCIYCMPEEGIQFVPHDDILTYEEMLRVVGLCVRKGIRKVRLTGGEPLVRQGIVGFIEKLNRIEGLEKIAVTTNGVLLKEYASSLKEAGIRHINVSMDTLRRDRFERITRRDAFDKVWAGIEEAESLGFDPIKINVVALRGVNDDEVLDFARLTREKPYHIRFIEMMPIGENNSWSRERFISAEEILARILPLGKTARVGSGPLDGPADYYRLEGARGTIGFIGALSNHFCARCNRLRLTASGQLRGCLFSDDETEIRTPLRKGEGDDVILRLIEETILNKPASHGVREWMPRNCVRPMNRIGG
jgi:cyclic pyranopterin phosphate synthase